MKAKFILTTLLLGTLSLISCKNQPTDNSVMKLLEENPSSINWNPDSNKKQVESYSANVSVYTMDSRKSKDLTLDNKYRITSKNISNDMCFKIDIPKEYAAEKPKTYYSNSESFVICDTASGTVEQRIPLEKQNISNDLEFFSNLNTFSKINISEVLETSQRLSFDINNEDEQYMEISLPSKYFNDNTYQRISTKICFDKNQETVTQIEIVEIDEEEKEITTTIMPVYEIVNDIPVKTAEVSIIHTIDPNAEQVENPYGLSSIDEIPEISEKEAKKLMEDGVMFESIDYDLGLFDTSDYTETIVEVYETIEINNVEDSVFRVLLESE